MDKIILVYVQMEQTGVFDISLELLVKSQTFSSKYGYQIYTIAVGNCIQKYDSTMKAYWLDKAYYYHTEEDYDSNIVAECVVNLCNEIQPDIVLFGATKQGRSVAPCVAALLQTGLTADCTELEIGEQGELIQIRPAFQETMLASIITSTRPQMATVRPGVFSLPEKNATKPCELIARTVQSDKKQQITILSETLLQQQKSIDITKEKVLVVIGAGVKNKEDADIFCKWAKTLGGTFACSRKLVERGWFSTERQVGLSGNCVEAELMITVGVSGSVQFQAGIKKVKHIIAINVDAQAPIMHIAQTAIALDMECLKDALIKK